MLKRLGVALITLIALISAFNIVDKTMKASTSAPVFEVEAKHHSIVGGTLNGATFSSTDPYLYFDSSKKDYVSFGSFNPSKNVTVYMTLKPTTMPASASNTVVIGNTEGGGMGLVVRNYLYQACIALESTTESTTYTYLEGSEIVKGREVSIAFTYDGSTFKLYENGVLINSKKAVGTITPAINDTIWGAGADFSGSGPATSASTLYFNGGVKSLKVYSATLTDKEIKDTYDKEQHLYNPEITFIKDNETIEEAINISNNITLAVADKYDVSNNITNGVSFCLLDTMNACIVTNNPVMDIIDNGNGTFTTDIHKGGKVKVRATFTENAPSGIYTATKDVTLTTKALEGTYTPKPQGGKMNYEYAKNVALNTVVGEIDFDNFYQPNVVISIKSSTDIAHANDYLNFVPSMSSTSSSPIDIKIGNGGTSDFTNGYLKAKTYKFKVEIMDGTETVTKDVTIVVDKTTPTISFSTTTQKDMIIGESAFTDSIVTSNTDTLSISDVSYSLSGGVSNVLTVSNDVSDPTKYTLDIVNIHGGIGLPTTYNLNASIKETDNFKAITTTTSRKIYTYKALSSLTWSPFKGSFSTTDVNAANSIVGTLLGVDGVGSFTYEVVKSTDADYDPVTGADNASFTVANTPTGIGTSVQVKTTTALTPNIYQIQFKVTDSKGKSAFTNGTITVSAKGQAALEFKDKAGGTIITTTGMKVKFDDIASKLIAEGGTTSGAIQYDYAPQSMQPNSVNPSSYARINQTSGLISPIRIGTIKVQATRPGDATYDPIITFMMLTIEPAPQIADFNDKSSVVTIAEGKTKKVDAKGSITSSGAIGKGGITYASSDPNIATVDPTSGDVTGIKAGNVIITATLNSSDPSNSNFEANYDTVNATKAVKVYEPMKLNWVTVTPNLKAEANAIGNKAGTISVTNNASDPDFAISSNSTSENTDASFFQVVDNGTTADLKLAKKITASDWANHGGSFKVQIDVSDINGTQTINIIVVVDEAENDVSFTEDGTKITSLTKKYGENGNTFNLTSISNNGGGTIYSVIPDPNGVLNVGGTGNVTIVSSGTATVQVLVSAGNGYAQKTVTMPVTVSPGDQSISFIDTAILNQPFIVNGTFSDSAELKETSLNTVSTRTITYTSNTPLVCAIDAAGTVTMLKTGICDIDASNRQTNWVSVTTNKKINLYDGMGISFVPALNLQAESVSTGSGSNVGSLIVSGGIGNKTYAVSSVGGAKNKDAGLFQVNSSGIVSFKKAIMASDLVGKYNSTKKVYELYVQFETTDSGNTSKTTDVIIELKGAQLKAEFDTDGTGKITEVFGPGKTFALNLSSNKGKGVPTYQLKNDSAMPSDVLSSVDASGLATIQHANDPTFVGSPLMVEAIIPANDGYDEETIEVVVEITKAPQPDFAFKTPNIKVGVGALYTPLFTGNLSGGTITMHSPKPKSVKVVGSDLIAGDEDDVVVITADDSGDRDYQSAVAQATVIVSSAPSYSLIVSVPSATYGDTGLKATAKAVGSVGTNPNLTWSSSDPSIADIDESGNITIFEAGSVIITCVRTTTGEPSVSSTATLDIDPKAITIAINDKSKYVGETVPSFDMTIPNGILVPGDTISLPNFICLDTSNTPVINTTPAGNYSIAGKYPTGANPNYAITVTAGSLTVKQDVALPTWYHLEGVTSRNTLDPTKWHNEDVKVVLDTAAETAGTYDEISLDQTLWDENAISINTEGENSKNVFFRIKTSGILSTIQTTTIKIDKTKPIVKSITGTPTNKDALSTLINNLTLGTFFKQGTLVSINSEEILPVPNVKVSGLQEVSYEVYEIDRKTGIINSTPLDAGKKTPIASGVIEVKLDGVGLYRVCAIVKDNAGNLSSESCSDINIKKIDIDIDEDGENEFQDPGNDGCPDINIPLQDEKGSIYKINVDRDDDGIPDLDIDSNGDGLAEINVDIDKDGKPDLNLVNLTKWEPIFCVFTKVDNEGKPFDYCTMKDIKAVINVDLGKDNIPDIDIDIDGDLKADFNITKDGKTPSMNIGIIHRWEPNKDFTIEDFTYDTMEIDKKEMLTNIDTDKNGKPDLNIDFNGDGKPDINIDTDGDWIPNIKIDGNGDGESDINLDTNKDGVPDENIVDMKEWKPNLDGDKDGFLFDTMQGLQGKDEIEDNNVVVKKPDGGIFLPNFSLKVNDITDTVEEKFKNDILKDEEEKIIVAVYDVKLMKDQTQVEPDGKLQIRIPLPKGVKNPYLVIEQADGTLVKVDAEIKDGHLIYESDYLGKICVLGDKTLEETPDINNQELPNTSLKGTYTGGIGGAGTGDTTIYIPYLAMILTAMITIITIRKKRSSDEL